ncbi:MAG: class I SAM-dependent methyltransferase [Patescibacteria group bacterium]
MTNDKHIVSESWNDYELLDSGDNMKLERFGEIIVARPETQALWRKLRPELWNSAHAVFEFKNNKGSWDMKKPVPESWELKWNDARFLARLTGFKHTGIFPEQAPNWEWLSERCRDVVRPTSDVGRTTSYIPQVLNLFGYTGIASLVSAQAGAFVTHVDASKQSLDWAHENAKLSEVGEDKIRWILDDVLTFVKREARRGAKYDGIILDPPAFGRGAKGEVWKIEEDFQTLLESLKELLSDKSGSFFLLNGYAAGYASCAFAQAVESVFGNVDGESGELHIKESTGERIIPSGIYVRFVR